jgi:MtN3 and saliva related transmembrane protein
MNLVDLLGYFGAFLILIVITSCVVWLIYAVNVKSGPVLAANMIVLALALMLFYFKMTFPAKPKNQ